MDENRKPAGRLSRLVKWARVVFFAVSALLIFYAGITFRVIVIPDYYVALHPFVLPGQNWVYRYANSFGNSPDCGDIVLFSFMDADGRKRRHISHVAAIPGQTVEYLPGTRAFRINGSEMIPGDDFSLSGRWDHASYEKISLGRNEYLLFDNNAGRDGRRLWKIEKKHIIGTFLFQLPF